MMGVLLQDNKIRRASHNMVAYRIALPGSGTFIQDYDDDGETAAGSRMLHLLQVRSAPAARVCAGGRQRGLGELRWDAKACARPVISDCIQILHSATLQYRLRRRRKGDRCEGGWQAATWPGRA